MDLEPFHLERYFARHEFSARYLLSSSDCEALSLAELLDLADDECRRLWEGLRLGYTESLGLPLLREEVARLYQGVTADEVIEVVPEEGILLAMVTLLEPGDHVIVTWPGYQTLYGIARQMGCEVTYWQPDEEAGWRFDVDDVRRALRPTTRLIVVNMPHNPTGSLLSREDFEALLALADEAGVTVFSDEMYRWLEQDPSRLLPAAVERSPRAVTLCGLSKTFSLPGLRVGWLVTHDRDAYRRLAAAKDYTTICGSAPGEVLAVVALRHAAAIAARNRERVAANSARFARFVAAHPDLFSWTPPAAGSIALARLRAPEGATAFCDRLVEEAGVMLLPASVFGYGDGHVRIGLGRDTFAAGLAELEAWLARRR